MITGHWIEIEDCLIDVNDFLSFELCEHRIIGKYKNQSEAAIWKFASSTDAKVVFKQLLMPLIITTARINE